MTGITHHVSGKYSDETPFHFWPPMCGSLAHECERIHALVKTQCALPNAETAAMLFRALMASGQITMRRVDGWQTLDQAPVEQPLDLAV